MIKYNPMEEKSVYLVLSQTGTMFSRMLKLFTGAEYNHSSISLNPTLEEMYSFGRLNPYNPFIGGFVQEGKNVGTFKRFYKTKALVLELKVTEDQYRSIEMLIDHMKKNKSIFHYNYWGVFCAIFKANVAPRKRFYCSQFVRTCLASFDVSNSNELPKVIKPIDFLKLKNKRIIYQGILQNYNLIGEVSHEV